MFIITMLSFLCLATAKAQNGDFNGTLVNEEYGIRLHLDLDEETVSIPGMSFLGDTHGYLDGKTGYSLYGVWMLIRHSVEGNKAKLRFSNDIGSDSQDVTLTQVNDSTFEFVATGGNSLRKIEGKKLVKIVSSMTMHRESWPERYNEATKEDNEQ